MDVGVCGSISDAGGLEGVFDFIEEHTVRFFKPAEDDSAFEESLEALVDSPLPVKSANCFIPGDMKCVGPERDLVKLCDWSRTVFSRAEKSKTEIIVFGSGGSRSLPDGVSKEEGVRHFTELLADIGPIAEEYGITVVVEPLASEFCNFINSVAEAGRIVKDVDHPDIKLLADFYHMSRDSQGPGDLLKYGEHIRHIHLAEKERRTPPGIDRFDFMPYLKALAEAGYSGAFSFEAAWDDLKTQAAGSAAYFRSLIDKAGF